MRYLDKFSRANYDLIVACFQLQSKNAKKRNKRKGKMNPLSSPDNLEWTTMTPKTIWNQLRSEMKQYYDWEMPCETLEAATEQFTLQKISLLR
jgi:protein TIF31